MNWTQKQVSFYSGVTDTTGRPETFRNILLCESVMNIGTMVSLKNLNPEDPDYKTKAWELKKKLPLFAPSALMATRQAGNVQLQELSGLMQIDWDYPAIKDYDIDELKACIFNLPFTAYVSKSCSGVGIYALAAIAEPERLREYAEHCFAVFEAYGISPDTSKGRNAQDLRFVSYDSNMLIRDNPEPLRVTHFKAKPDTKKVYDNNYVPGTISTKNALVRSELMKIRNASVGNRWPTIQKVAYTLGGMNDQTLLKVIKTEIEQTPEFTGQEKKYLKCAEDCFAAGTLKPLNPA